MIISSIKLETSHFLANMLALTKILNIPIKEAKKIAKLEPGIKHNVSIRIPNSVSIDKLSNELKQFEITITITNQ